jgi:hypothetical protein
MYRTAKRINIWSKEWAFSQGYIDNTQNLHLPEWASPYLRNCRLDWHSITIRPWHQLLATLTDWDYPKWIWEYYRADPANNVLVVRHNQEATKKLVTITSAWVVTAITTAANIASDNRMSFSNIWDVVYCMNGSDDFWKLSWTTYTTPNVWIASFAPSFAVSFNSSHWASWWSSNPNKVYKSVWDNYEDFNSAWSDIFTFEDIITSLATNNQSLFYFTKNTISVTDKDDITDTAWTITYVTRPLQVKEWAINNATTVTAGNRVFFVTPSKKICEVARSRSVDWFEVLELSERKYQGISKIMSELDDDQSDAFGYFLPKENLIKWFFKLNWSSLPDICIVYDVQKDKFLVDNSKFFYDWVHFDGRNYTISMVESKVYRDEYWLDDEWSAIPFEYYTKEFYISEPTFKKLLWETRTLLDINLLADLFQEIWIDWALKDTKEIIGTDLLSLSTWGIGTESIWVSSIGTEWEEEDETEDSDYNEIWIIRTKWNLNVRMKKMQFRFRNQVVGSKVRLKNINAKVDVLPELTNNLT